MKKLLLLVCLSSVLSVSANVRLPKLFGDNMVLQRERTIIIWGWADPKEKITVQLNQQTKSITADKSGNWRIDLAPEIAGGPYTLSVKGKNSLQINDVLVGEVWICSGQSNMEMPLAGWGQINNYEKEIAAANYPLIREFAVQKVTATTPQNDVASEGWKICNPQNTGNFSAVAYFFARELYNELHVPVGLINTSWGGTMVETWISHEAFANDNAFKAMIDGMPVVNLEELQKTKAAAIKERLAKIQGPTLPTPAEIKLWKESDFKDDDWHPMDVPGIWEGQEPGDIDGVIWLRKTIVVSAEDAGKPAVLELAMIDDKDETYINGVLVGSGDRYNISRKYKVAAGVLKEGKNVIAVRITDTGGAGGIYGGPADVKLSMAGHELSLAGKWVYKIESVSVPSSAVGPNSYPTLLYNAMIHPLIPYAIKGAIWYQGESNAGRAYEYRSSFPLMINDWRKRWQQGDFPFYFVQLSSWNARNGNSQTGSEWAELREAQTLTLSLPNTGMAVTTDIGDAKDIHPKNKQDVGKRLAAVALNKTYGRQIVYSGPQYESFKTDGNKIIVSFTNTGSTLLAKDKYGYLKGFEIAGDDQQFVPARAFVEGDKVVVMNPSVNHPVAVRYGWADDAGENNLFNKEGFPAAPFRTDNWKMLTANNKYRIGQ